MELQEILEYIRQTAGEEPEYLKPVSGGLSNAEKYKTKVLGSEWMVKIIDGTPVREMWYHELNNRSDDTMANPKMYRLFPDGKLCLLAPWIAGESLEKKLETATNQEIKDYAVQAANILLNLHKLRFDYPAYELSLKKRTEDAITAIKTIPLTFPGYEECCDYLQKAIQSREVKHLCFVHRDVRPENFIVKDGKLHLIDFDNGSLGERASDFTYITTMVREDHRAFSRMVIKTYLEKAESEDFWQENLLYSTLQVVEYAIWKWNIKGRQVCLQAENLLNQYSTFKTLIPLWYQACACDEGT